MVSTFIAQQNIQKQTSYLLLPDKLQFIQETSSGWDFSKSGTDTRGGYRQNDIRFSRGSFIDSDQNEVVKYTKETNNYSGFSPTAPEPLRYYSGTNTIPFTLSQGTSYTQVLPDSLLASLVSLVKIGSKHYGLYTKNGQSYLLDFDCLVVPQALQSSPQTYTPPDPLQEVTIYPNPATQQAFIDLNMLKGAPTQVRIYDAYGKLHHSASSTATVVDLDLTGWESGVYMVRLETEGVRARVMKLVVVGL
jgi:Secretion system C-terminal sorting domain